MNLVLRKMESGNIKLSVVIASYNGAGSIGRCLESLTRQAVPCGLYEVIVVDNNSTDDTAKVASKYVEAHENFSLLSESRQGVSPARNKGISAAKGRYICFMDDDAYADDCWLERVLNAFETVGPPPAVVGGRTLPYYTTEKPAWFTDSLEIRSEGNHARFLCPKECLFGFSESNFCIRKSTLDEIGGFSTDLGPKGDKMIFGEGAELSSRIARRYPHFWYDPELVVYHLVPERNMSITYILSRNFQTARCYQAFESANADLMRNAFTFVQCTGRILVYFFCSILCVRWFTRHSVPDWLRHAIPMVNCLSRSLYLIKYLVTPHKK